MGNVQYTLSKTYPYPLGAYVEEKGVRFSFVSSSKDCGIVIYSKEGTRELIPLTEEYCIGSLYSVVVSGTLPKDFSYMLWMDGEEVEDPYAQILYPKRAYAKEAIQRCKINYSYFLEGEDEFPKLPYADKVFYMLHPRGYTKHSSSKVTQKGTIAGVTEKLGYLKELGITSIILMPVYEFQEMMGKVKLKYPDKRDIASDLLTYQVDYDLLLDQEIKTNFWGYGDENHYFALKDSYFCGDAVAEYITFIKEAHKLQLEVFMQIYFPSDTPVRLIEDVLLYWRLRFHVDGFHLMGANIPVIDLLQAPFLSDTYLLFENAETGLLEGHDNCAILSNPFMFDMRNFLKGEPNLAFEISRHIRTQYQQFGCVHYMAKQDTMRMMDMVSYQEKHNEENGEKNSDGSNYNCSWNCGIEGNTRKKQIVGLRSKQLKNAFGLLLLSQGTPLIYGGDEFGKTQNGNNNPYCQDNEISYLLWKELDKNKELYEFVKSLLALRRQYPILKGGVAFQGNDYASYGCPDISFHGEEAWRTDFQSGSHVFGVMYSNRYFDANEDSYLYVAYNMHWEKHQLALPNIPKGCEWDILMTTDSGTTYDVKKQMLCMQPRSIAIMLGKNSHI